MKTLYKFRKRFRAGTVGGTCAKTIVIGLVGALTVALSGCAGTGDGEAGQVVRIIDGDTLVISLASGEETVRLLNVDTPETKHPDEPVECLGLEATAFLEQLVPPGTRVGLDFDVERQDQYGRTLAAVFTEDETLVNAEIARQGLGIPVLFEPNEKYYSAVQDAHAQAQMDQTGLYDAGVECTVPAEVAQASQAIAEAIAAPAGSSSEAVVAAAAALAAALAAAETVDAAFDADRTAVRWVAMAGAGATGLAAGLAAKIADGQDQLLVLETKAERLKEAEVKAAAEKKAEAKRKAAEKAEQERKESEAKAQVEREAAAAAERERIRNLAPAPAPYVPPAPAPYVPTAPAPYVPPAPADPYPGYTGPRCYAPGGLTWKPCP